MRRLPIVVAAALTGSIIACCAGPIFIRGMMSADPYPTFMAGYQPKGSRTYDEAIRAFPDFIARTFPIGSDASDAIAQMTKGGFVVARSSPEMVVLGWKRHSGPCSEQYSIAVGRDVDGRIAAIDGELRPICL
jgi:hypothetical protein